MTSRIYVRQGGGSASRIDYSALAPKGTPFFEHNTPLVQMGQKFADGEAAVGQIKVMDPFADIPDPNYRLKAHATVELTEDASGTEYTIAFMRIAPQEAGRRTKYVAADELEHDVTLHDCNMDLRGLPFRSTWSRPAETDIERLAALQASKLNGSSSTANLHRVTTTITVDTEANGHLVYADAPVNMDAKIYPPGTNPVDVIRDCAEQASKVFGVVLHHEDGVGTHRCLRYTNELDHTWASPIKISDVVDDWDPDSTTAPVFEPNWLRGKGRIVDNDFVLSGLISRWSGTNDDPRIIEVDVGEPDEEWETWWDIYEDGDSETETQATRRAQSIVNARKTQHLTGRISILMHANQLHLITAGQSIEVKSAVISGGEGPNDYKDRRVAECIFEPAADGLWWAHLLTDRPMRLGIPNPGGGQPKSTSPKPKTTDFIRTDTTWRAFEHASLASGEINPEPADWKEVGYDDSVSPWVDAIASGEFDADTDEITHPNNSAFLRRHEVFFRKEFYIAADQLTGSDVAFHYYADDGMDVYINGTLRLSVGTQWSGAQLDASTTVPRSHFQEGLNCIAVYVWNQENGSDGGNPPAGCVLGLTIEIEAADHDLGDSTSGEYMPGDAMRHASQTPITDLGGHFDSGNVEGALQEIAAKAPPAGGTTGQILAKASADDHDMEWVDPGGGTARESLCAHWTRDRTKTNVGTSYTDVYNITGANGLPVWIDFVGKTQARVAVWWNKIGAGTQAMKLCDPSDETKILHEFTNLATGENDSGLVSIPAHFSGAQKRVKMMVKSTTGTDDPVFEQALVWLK